MQNMCCLEDMAKHIVHSSLSTCWDKNNGDLTEMLCVSVLRLVGAGDSRLWISFVFGCGSCMRSTLLVLKC